MNEITETPEPVLLIIADISGYTRYMTANAKTLSHSQTIITELVKSIIHLVELPMEVAKLEGDAVFLYCRKQQDGHNWNETRSIIGAKLLMFFKMFSEKIEELSQSTICNCTACTHIDKLRLKVVVHSGEALFHRVFNFLELAGVDVIIVHRLLKNSLSADQYILLTTAARRDVEFPPDIALKKGRESYDEIGVIDTLTYLPGANYKTELATARVPFSTRYSQSWSLYYKLWFSPLASYPGTFRHVTSGACVTGRAASKAISVLGAVFFVPVGAVFVLVHASRKRVKKASLANAPHEHSADGSCCKS